MAAAEEVGKKAIGSAADATIGTMLSDPFAIAASSPGFLSIPKPQLIPSGFLELAIGSARVYFIFLSISFICAARASIYPLECFTYLCWVEDDSMSTYYLLLRVF